MVRKPQVPSGVQRQLLGQISLPEDVVQETAVRPDIPCPLAMEKELCQHHLHCLFDCVGPLVGSAPRKVQGMGFAYPQVSKWESD